MHGISKKVILNLSVEEEISLWENTILLCGIICHEGEQFDCGHYTCGLKLDNI